MFVCPCTKGELGGRGELNLDEHRTTLEARIRLRTSLLELNYDPLRTVTIEDLRVRDQVDCDYRARLRRTNLLIGLCWSGDSEDQRWYASLLRHEAGRRKIPVMIIFFSGVVSAQGLSVVHPCRWNNNPKQVAVAASRIIEEHREMVSMPKEDGLLVLSPDQLIDLVGSGGSVSAIFG